MNRIAFVRRHWALLLTVTIIAIDQATKAALARPSLFDPGAGPSPGWLSNWISTPAGGLALLIVAPMVLSLGWLASTRLHPWHWRLPATMILAGAASNLLSEAGLGVLSPGGAAQPRGVPNVFSLSLPWPGGQTMGMLPISLSTAALHSFSSQRRWRASGDSLHCEAAAPGSS